MGSLSVSASSILTSASRNLSSAVTLKRSTTWSFSGVRRAEHVEHAERMRRKPNGVDDELAVLVLADRLTVPGRLHVFRMPVGQEDATHPLVALPDHVHDLRRLHDVERLGGPEQLTRRTARPAARLRQEWD